MAPSVAIVTSRRRKAVVGAVVVLIIGAVAWAIIDRFRALDEEGPRARDERAVPIEVVTLATGSLTERRRFSGSLESPGRFVVAPKVGGRVEAVHVDLEDEVAKGQVVVELDDAARAHAVATAEAELKVARAQRAEAASAHSQAERELRRVQRLHGGGLASDAQLEAAEAAEQAQTARVASARAEIARAAAAVEAARVELADTQVTASWREGEAARVVGERRVNEGDTVAANTPLLVVVALDPLRAVIQLTEDSYGHISHDQTVTLTADAWPDERFTGRVARIAPMFQEGSRQARVEVEVPNPDGRLKRGMYARVQVDLRRVEDVTVAPSQALTRRRDEDGVFVLDEEAMVARWRPVEIGLREADRVELVGASVGERVLTLGQQLVEDGTPVTIPDEGAATDDAADRAAGVR